MSDESEDNTTNFTPGAFPEWISSFVGQIAVATLGSISLAELAWEECSKRAQKYVHEMIDAVGQHLDHE